MLDIIDNKIASPIRQIKGKAELLSNSAASAFGKYVTFNEVIPTEKVKVKVASKNLANQEELVNTSGNIDRNSACIINENGNFYIEKTEIQSHFSNYVNISIAANTTFTISLNMVSYDLYKDDGTIYPLMGIHTVFTDGTGEYVGSNRISTTGRITLKTLTYDKEVAKIRVYIVPEPKVGSYVEFNDFQIELGSAASAYTPYMPLEGGKGALYFEGIYANEIGDTYMGDSGIYTVSNWYWNDSGELNIYFEGGRYYLYITTNHLEYDTSEDLLADLEIPIGTKLYYDTETDSLYYFATGLVGNTITVGNQNLFNENKDYGNSIAVLEENGEKVFTHINYDREGVNREYIGLNIDDIWQLAYDKGLKLTISFDIKTAIDGTVQVYTLGKNALERLTGNRNINTTTEWQRFSYTARAIQISSSEMGEYCDLSFYGTYYSGVMPFVKNIQIEIGETVTDYVPYQSAEYTIDDTLTIEAIPYAPTTVIYPNSSGVFIEKAECKVCTCENTFSCSGDLQEITIERVGEESKFFGFGICQKANIKALDTKREKSITTDNYFRIGFSTGESYVNNYPFFYVTETHRDENTNAISVTAYDVIKTMEKHTVGELELGSYSLLQFAETCAKFFGLTLDIQGVEDLTLFNLEYESGANFEGTETIRQALNAVAEATQTIYFVTENTLVFKQLVESAAAAYTIGKADYITLQSKDNRRLQAICATNELGDATTASISALGTTQFIRDNPFLELREDIADILDTAIAAVGGLTINQFTCSWRGNYLLEIGDKIDLETKDSGIVTSFVLNDTITYNGSFSESTQWNYTDSTETATNPTTIGEALKQTYAKVDKANKQIDIVASETGTNREAISALQLTTNNINASVTGFEKKINENGETVSALAEKVEAQITQDEVNISIQKALENGVDKVETSTGFTFNEEGLTVSKSDSEISTTITEDGMAIRKGSKDMLTATNEGVKAEDLHATTFLIIGNNSRLESKGKRTYCYWIGG